MPLLHFSYFLSATAWRHHLPQTFLGSALALSAATPRTHCRIKCIILAVLSWCIDCKKKKKLVPILSFLRELNSIDTQAWVSRGTRTSHLSSRTIYPFQSFRSPGSCLPRHVSWPTRLFQINWSISQSQYKLPSPKVRSSSLPLNFGVTCVGTLASDCHILGAN